MQNDIPRAVLQFWKDGKRAKKQGKKEEALKEFLGFYDLLNTLKHSYNTNYSPKQIKKRMKAVRREIAALLQDADYLKTTRIPPEGIREIKATVGLIKEEAYHVYGRHELLDASIYVKRPTSSSLEIVQLALIDYRKKSNPTQRELRMEITCEGKKMEFVYDKITDPISLQTIAYEILNSSGVNFSRLLDDKQTLFLQQLTYPSLRDLLKFYLVKGNWIAPPEANKISVIGYP